MSQALAGPTKYSPEEIERGLFALVLTGGNALRASKELKARGYEIARQTLSDWKTTYAERLAELRVEQAPKIEAVIVREARDSAVLAAQVEHAGLMRLHENLESLDLKDVSKTVRDASVTKGVNVDQVLKLEGRPTTIVEHHRDVVDVLRSLNEIAPGLVVDGSAEEIPESSE